MHSPMTIAIIEVVFDVCTLQPLCVDSLGRKGKIVVLRDQFLDLGPVLLDGEQPAPDVVRHIGGCYRQAVGFLLVTAHIRIGTAMRISVCSWRRFSLQG